MRYSRNAIVVKGYSAERADLFHTVLYAAEFFYRSFGSGNIHAEMLCRLKGKENILPVVFAEKMLVIHRKRQRRVLFYTDLM